MSTKKSQRATVTSKSRPINVEERRLVSRVVVPIAEQPAHRRKQKIFTTERLPTIFAWSLLLVPSLIYWIFLYPQIFDCLPSFSPLLIFHFIAFIYLCINFFLATFVDPVNSMKSFSSTKFERFRFFREFINNR